MKKLKKIWAFTLVELIIVITILAVLATIAFVSFTWYAKSSRDTQRVATVKNLDTWLNLNFIQTWRYPLPDNISWTWTLSWAVVAYVWTAGESVARFAKLSNIPTDPLTGNFYYYWVSSDGKFYQVSTIVENNTAYSSLISQSYADEWEYVAYVEWNYQWILKYNNGNLCLANVPSLLFNGEWNVNLQSEIGFIVNKKQNIPYSNITKKTVSEILSSVSTVSEVNVECNTLEEWEEIFTQTPEVISQSLWYSSEAISNIAFWGKNNNIASSGNGWTPTQPLADPVCSYIGPDSSWFTFWFWPFPVLENDWLVWNTYIRRDHVIISWSILDWNAVYGDVITAFYNGNAVTLNTPVNGFIYTTWAPNPITNWQNYYSAICRQEL